MNNKSIKINFIMNIILTSSTYIFPLVTFPYISRVLQAAGNGKVNFALSVINYFAMFASLGIPMYGIKACAVVRDNKEKLSKTVHELFIINFITSILSFLVLIIMIILIPQFHRYSELLLIDSIAIWLNLVGIEWMFKALEEYVYITNKSIGFKIIGIILMFIFVHNKSDYSIYAIISLISGSGSMLLNLVYAKKFISFKKYERYNLLPHIKPIFSFFLLSASWTIYTNLDSVMLGFISGDAEVGYYTAAVKLKGILISTISALGTVLLPRLTNYYYENKKKEFYELIKKDEQFITVSAFYFMIFCIINAKEIILFLSGNTYLQAVPAMKIISISILFIGYSTMLGTNILIPMGKEQVTMVATIVGIVVDTCLNIFLIPLYGAAGAAAATVVGEASICLVELICLRDKIVCIYDIKDFVKTIISLSITSIILILLKNIIVKYIANSFLIILITGISYSCVYVISLLLSKEEILLYSVNLLKKKFDRSK